MIKDFPKNLAETLASTLDSSICIEIFFQNDGLPSHIELEQCDDEEYDDEDESDEEDESDDEYEDDDENTEF